MTTLIVTRGITVDPGTRQITLGILANNISKDEEVTLHYCMLFNGFEYPGIYMYEINKICLHSDALNVETLKFGHINITPRDIDNGGKVLIYQDEFPQVFRKISRYSMDLSVSGKAVSTFSIQCNK